MTTTQNMTGVELEIARWLSAFALQSDDEGILLEGFAERLAAAGLPVVRIASGSEVFHPIIDARGFRWYPGRGIERTDFARDAVEDEDWPRSPVYHMRENDLTELRRTLGRSYRQGEFPMLDRFVHEGATDYLAFLIGFAREATLGAVPGVFISFNGTRPGGFEPAEVDLLRRLSVHFAHAYKTISTLTTSRVLMSTYLGADPSRRVLDGAIVRGKAETVQAVLWYSDLEGFTRIADTEGKDQLLGLLNEYADCLVSTIAAHDGEVLKFMGDGILAMFPLGKEGSCARALSAAAAALESIDSLSGRRAEAGLPRADIHLALHVGEVLYGNIGSRDRLDFTVVGPAVNEVARIEAKCRSLDQRVVTSAAFAEAAGPCRSRLVSLGRYALRGVRRPEELFTIDPDACRG
jgi:adenylate cyclase